MNALPEKKEKMTSEEYLNFEISSDVRHEFFNGEIFAMTGASLKHNRVSTNTVIELGGKLKAAKSSCSVFANDMRVKIQEKDNYVYPDIVVTCGDIELDNDKFDTLLNPMVIIEILSDSTEIYDRGKKFQNYQLIKSLQEYILISQDQCFVEQFVRQEDFTSWKYFSYKDLDQSVKIESINCNLVLSDIYYQIFEKD